ncbi:Hypothetical protein R9X50_00084600 [Acrodontium crateriforme]|uniref:Extensin domain-containing protein n=1 Tax=Acrodontium crateriforme TaxID=150365 RepID=A0AAQ3LY02_9PEZI|nr:Hypothetical protein R9X50_00084600 [Acrodontium crateriforme]
MEFLRSLTSQRAPPAPTTGMDQSEELIAEVDEPPDHMLWHKQTAAAQFITRRESLLTRQLHSEAEPSDDESATPLPQPPRTFSTHSAWSTHSGASTAELTSDDGRSMSSPTVSPPLVATSMRNALPFAEKPLDRKVVIVQHDNFSTLNPKKDIPTGVNLETSVETGLGRKRCITFACGNKEKPKAPTPPPESEAPVTSSPPKRKCSLKFVCPNRSGAETKPEESIKFRRAASPAPRLRKPVTPSKSQGLKVHRGSDSTVTHGSPKSVRKAPPTIMTTPIPISIKEIAKNRLALDSDESDREATRFHEFATSDDEPEEWVQESTCHRKRLTINDTLQRENVIRKACEEVEEEALEEEEEEDEEAEDELDEEGLLDDDQDEDEDDEQSEDSDDGFHSDNEEGFAASDSDSEGEDSDYEWWKPGGKSTAATSVEHLDRMTLTQNAESILASSVGSVSSGQMSPRLSRQQFHSARKSRNPRSRKIDRPEAVDLPDSTDFVCGTLDEDRPLEQAYLQTIKDREAAKYKPRPQDIDPSFPTSDPEMDEEDDEDLEMPEQSEQENFMHGDLDELDGDLTLRHRAAKPRSRKETLHSPPPPTRGRLASPPPPRRRSIYRSPPPTKKGTARSPPPPAKRRSPPPAKCTRSTAPRNLFGNSPRNNAHRSPAPYGRFASPPNTRRPSPAGRTRSHNHLPLGLAGRPQPTHTASLPRGGGFLLSRLSTMNSATSDHDGSDTPAGATADIPKRGAIDIVKGLEKKRQRRKEKMYQKLCAKAATKGEKPYKVKPGRGAERMREVGLELQRYRGTGQGRAEHILSV